MDSNDLKFDHVTPELNINQRLFIRLPLYLVPFNPQKQRLKLEIKSSKKTVNKRYQYQKQHGSTIQLGLQLAHFVGFLRDVQPVSDISKLNKPTMWGPLVCLLVYNPVKLVHYNYHKPTLL